MKNLLSTISVLAISAISLTTIVVGCRGNNNDDDDTISEVTEDQLITAVVNQTISGYHEASISVEVNDKSVNMSCQQGGTFSWNLDDSNSTAGDFCYNVSSTSCSLSGSYGELDLSGSYSACGFPVAIAEATATGVDSFKDDTALDIKGSITAAVSRTAGESSRDLTCDYELNLSKFKVSGSGNSATVSLDVAGTGCSGKAYGPKTISVTVSGSVSVAE